MSIIFAQVDMLLFEVEGSSAEGGGTHIRLSTLELAPVLRTASFRADDSKSLIILDATR